MLTSFVKNYLMFGEEVQFFFSVVYGITELYSSVIPCIYDRKKLLSISKYVLQNHT